MNAHPQAAETVADEALETPDPAAEARREASGGSADPAAAAARGLDLWERALAELARRGPPG